MKKELSTTQLATTFRAQFELGKEDPINLLDLLYRLDLITIFRPLSNGFSGMSQKTRGYKFILINTSHSLARQNFTICHEMYHLFYQENFDAQICITGKFNIKDKEEYRADCFAADLLLPEFGILKTIPTKENSFNGISLGTLLKIEHKFRCSRTALLFRLKIMGLIDSAFFDAHNTNIKRGAAEHGYTQHLYNPTNQELEIIGDYGDKAKQKFDDELISESHYISLMQDIGIDLDENITDDVEQ